MYDAVSRMRLGPRKRDNWATNQKKIHTADIALKCASDWLIGIWLIRKQSEAHCPDLSCVGFQCGVSRSFVQMPLSSIVLFVICGITAPVHRLLRAMKSVYLAALFFYVQAYDGSSPRAYIANVVPVANSCNYFKLPELQVNFMLCKLYLIFNWFHIKSCPQNFQETSLFFHFVPASLCTSHLAVFSLHRQRRRHEVPALPRAEVDTPR